MVAAAAPDLGRPNTTRLLAQGGTADPVGMALFLPSPHSPIAASDHCPLTNHLAQKKCAIVLERKWPVSLETYFLGARLKKPFLGAHPVP